MKLLKLFLLLPLLACNPDKGKLHFSVKNTKPVLDAVSEPEPIEEEVNFKSIKTQILDSKCIGCHKNYADEKNVLEFVKPGNPEESEFFNHVESGYMPPGKKSDLNTLELELIRDYINGLK